MMFFTIGVFDFQVNNGTLNIGFVDYEKLVEFAYEFNSSYELDLFISKFEDEVNTLKYGVMPVDIHNRLLGFYDKVLYQVLASTGKSLTAVLQEFYRYANYANLYKFRNVVGGIN